jgi:hypothetical protein
MMKEPGSIKEQGNKEDRQIMIPSDRAHEGRDYQ